MTNSIKLDVDYILSRGVFDSCYITATYMHLGPIATDITMVVVTYFQ